jgi:hypothetical protein
LSIVAGVSNGLPSPGHTTLTRLGGPGSDFQVDSFFDIFYRVDFAGCPGSPLAGMGGSTTGTIRMKAYNGPTFCPVAHPACSALPTNCQTNNPAVDMCWPDEVSTNTAGQVVVDACTCYQQGECGPIGIIPIGVPPFDFELRCDGQCNIVGEQCLIHINGGSTGASSILASAVPAGAVVTCSGCSEACCLPDGSCVEALPFDCLDLGGTPQGVGSNCSTVSCPQPVCEPNAAETACLPAGCDPATEECQERCVNFNPTSGVVRVTDCDCRPGDDCHVAFGTSGSVGRGSGGNPCVIPENPPASGTVVLPPPGCEYLSPEEVHEILDDLPAGVTIDFATIHKDFMCLKQSMMCSQTLPPLDCEGVGGALGGNLDCSESSLQFAIQGHGPGFDGYNRNITMNGVFMEVHTGPRNPGDAVQDFPTDMFRLQGQLFGDPDFCTLQITAGSSFGMPSPGHTTLTRLPGGNYAVDSFFDIEYRIDYVGCPGSILNGVNGSTTGTIRMETGGFPTCEGTCPTPEACVETRVVNTDGTIDLCCDCLALEACCLPNGTCQDLEAAACVAVGGTSQGAGSDCTTVDCPGPPCDPTANGQACQAQVCDDPPPVVRDCVPRCVSFDPISGVSFIDDCDCVDPAEDCHVNFVSNNIPPNSTLFVTVGTSSYFPFSERPVPAGFFFDGSPPLTQNVHVQSKPLVNYNGFFVGPTDTIIAQLEEAVLTGPGSSDTVAVQLAALSLQSIAPITVGSTQWDVEMGLSPTAPTLGTMTITQTSQDGGVWEGTLDIFVAARFTEVGNPSNVLVLDTAGSPPLVSGTTGPMPWSYETPPEYASVPGLTANFFTAAHEHTKEGHESLEATPALGALNRKAAGSVRMGGGGDPCVVADAGGTVVLPPAGCEYLTGDEVHMIIDGLPAGTTIELAPIHKDFACNKQPGANPCSQPILPGLCEDSGGGLGGNLDCSTTTLSFEAQGTGALGTFNRTVDIPMVFMEVHTGPRTPGDPVQSFDTEMFRLQGELFGDPDFCTLRIRAGSGFGMPSPGHTTLTQLPGGQWHVDSFFDIFYEIDFAPCPGSPLDIAGAGPGSTTGTIRMKTGGLPDCRGNCLTTEECTREVTVDALGLMHVCCNCQGCGTCQLYGDVVSPSCVVDIDDVLAMLGAFGNANPCVNFPDYDIAPCGGNCPGGGSVDIDEVLAVLDGFAGNFACDHPCPPGPCCIGGVCFGDADGNGNLDLSKDDCQGMGGVWGGLDACPISNPCPTCVHGGPCP